MVKGYAVKVSVRNSNLKVLCLVLVVVLLSGCLSDSLGFKPLWANTVKGYVLRVDVSDSGFVAVITKSKYVLGDAFSQPHVEGEDALQLFDPSGKMLWRVNFKADKDEESSLSEFLSRKIIAFSQDSGLIFVTSGTRVHLFSNEGKEIWDRALNGINSPSLVDNVYVREDTFIAVDFNTSSAYYLNISGGLIKVEHFDKFPRNVASKYGYNAMFIRPPSEPLDLLATFKDDEQISAQSRWLKDNFMITSFEIPYEKDYFVAGAQAPKFPLFECEQIVLMDFSGVIKQKYVGCVSPSQFLINNYRVGHVGISDNGRYVVAEVSGEVKMLEVAENA